MGLRFSEHNLQTLFESPSVPQYLFSSIRSLAVRGKLTERTEADESVDALMKRVRLEVSRQAKRKPQRRTRFGAFEASHFEIPATWRWTKLEDLLVFGPRNGYSPKSVDYETPVRSLTPYHYPQLSSMLR